MKQSANQVRKKPWSTPINDEIDTRLYELEKERQEKIERLRQLKQKVKEKELEKLQEEVAKRIRTFNVNALFYKKQRRQKQRQEAYELIKANVLQSMKTKEERSSVSFTGTEAQLDSVSQQGRNERKPLLARVGKHVLMTGERRKTKHSLETTIKTNAVTPLRNRIVKKEVNNTICVSDSAEEDNELICATQDAGNLINKYQEQLLLMDHIPSFSVSQKYAKGKLPSCKEKHKRNEEAERLLPVIWHNPSIGIQVDNLFADQDKRLIKDGALAKILENHYLDKTISSPLNRLKVTQSDIENAKISAQSKNIEVNGYQGFVVNEKHAENKKKEERKGKYWNHIVKTDFKPKPSKRKEAEIQIQLMKERRVPKKKFNFVNLEKVCIAPKGS